MRNYLAFIVTTVLLVGTIVLSGFAARRIPEPLITPLSTIDPHISGWNAVADNTLAANFLRALDATAVLSRTYRKASTDLDLFIGFYAQQRAGESMHSPKHCLPGGGWEIWRHESASVPVNGQMIRINKYSIQKMGTRMLMLYWYQSKERIVASEYVGKLLLARDTLMTGRTGGSIVRVMLPDTPGAVEEGITFASQLIPEVHRCFTGEKVYPTK